MFADCGEPSWWSSIHPSSCTLNAQNECIQAVGSYTFKSRGPVDIDWDGVKDFEWCIWKTDVTPSRCDLAKSGTQPNSTPSCKLLHATTYLQYSLQRSFVHCHDHCICHAGTKQSFRKCIQEGWVPAAPYISGEQTDLLQVLQIDRF